MNESLCLTSLRIYLQVAKIPSNKKLSPTNVSWNLWEFFSIVSLSLEKIQWIKPKTLDDFLWSFSEISGFFIRIEIISHINIKITATH